MLKRMKKFLLGVIGYVLGITIFFFIFSFVAKKATEAPYTDYQYDYEVKETVAYHWNFVPVIEQNGNKVTVEYNGNLYSYKPTKPVTEDKVWIAFVDDTDIIVDAHKHQMIN